MVLAVIVGTLFDIIHKGSAKYFFENMRRSKGKGREMGGGEMVSIAVQTAVVDVLASGEFCNPKRRVAHLLGMYGFVLYIVATAVHGVRAIPPRATPADLADAVVDRRADGAASAATGSGSSSAWTSPPRATRRSAWCSADLFVLSLLASVTLGVVWAAHGRRRRACSSGSTSSPPRCSSSACRGRSSRTCSSSRRQPSRSGYPGPTARPRTCRRRPVTIRSNRNDTPWNCCRDAPMDMGLGIKREAPRHY